MRLIAVLFAALLLASITGCQTIPGLPGGIPGLPGGGASIPAGRCPAGLMPGLPIPIGTSGPASKIKWHKAECSSPISALPEVMICYYETAPNPVGETVLFGSGFTKKADVLKATQLYDGFIKAIKKPTRIVAYSFCSGAMITNYPNRSMAPVSATLDHFKGQILPAIEAKYPEVVALSGKYKLIGHSMGGSNVATLGALWPEKFSKLGLINPMLVEDSKNPFFTTGNPLFDFLICPACLLINDHFPNKSVWDAGKPSAIASAQMASTWITACKSDTFKLKPGSDEYVARLKALGLKPNYIAGKSGCSHDKFDGASLAKHLELN